MEEFIL
jgi:hypothetical protein